MKTLVCTEPWKFEYRYDVMPRPENGRALIKIRRIGICGTDLHAFEGTQPYFSYPRVLGHELAGELVEFDGSSSFVPGEPVTFIPYFNCGQCIACRNNKPNCCTQMRVCGVHVDGGMTEFLSVPTSSVLFGNGLTLDELALVEPLSIGAHGVGRAAVAPGEFVLVIGAGPIGLGTMEFARIAGANVIALDVNEDRLRFCKEVLNIPYTLNAISADINAELLSITGGDMPTVVIDATGNNAAIKNGFQYMAHGARYVLIGLQKENVSFSHPEFHKREATLMSSRNATRADFEYVIECIKTGKVNPLNYITHRVQFDKVGEEFSGWLKPASGVIKAMVELN